MMLADVPLSSFFLKQQRPLPANDGDEILRQSGTPQKDRSHLIPHQTNFDLPLDIGPFLCCAKVIK